MAKAFLTVLILASASFSLSACNTVDGFGKDLESTGRAIDNAF